MGLADMSVLSSVSRKMSERPEEWQRTKRLIRHPLYILLTSGASLPAFLVSTLSLAVAVYVAWPHAAATYDTDYYPAGYTDYYDYTDT